jgi:alkanesulfonate monooxygenase SsuD/methylene tetrahydromethanopterin reductase-like flavin-dependent oxidoreductase (luciferase family)
MSVWFGLHLPSYTHPDTPPEQLIRPRRRAGAGGRDGRFDAVTVMDHLYQIDGIGGPDEPMLEGWSVLAALARETSRVRLGTLVTGVTYRNPALLAKEATTLDTISGGRAILGLGAAWNDVEHEGYGYDFPPIGERMDRMEEALAIIKAMFTEDRPSFHGNHYRSSAPFNVPRPDPARRSEILVGGGGEQRTLRAAAKYADMTHWFLPRARGAQAQDRGPRTPLRGDRPRPVTIERTVGAPVIVTESEAAGKAFLERLPPERRPFFTVGTPEQAADGLRPYIEAGFTGFTFNNNVYRTPEQIALVGELLELVAGEAPVGSVARRRRVATREDLRRIALALPETTADETGRATRSRARRSRGRGWSGSTRRRRASRTRT